MKVLILVGGLILAMIKPSFCQNINWDSILVHNREYNLHNKLNNKKKIREKFKEVNKRRLHETGWKSGILFPYNLDFVVINTLRFNNAIECYTFDCYLNNIKIDEDAGSNVLIFKGNKPIASFITLKDSVMFFGGKLKKRNDRNINLIYKDIINKNFPFSLLSNENMYGFIWYDSCQKFQECSTKTVIVHEGEGYILGDIEKGVKFGDYLRGNLLIEELDCLSKRNFVGECISPPPDARSLHK